MNGNNFLQRSDIFCVWDLSPKVNRQRIFSIAILIPSPKCYLHNKVHRTEFKARASGSHIFSLCEFQKKKCRSPFPREMSQDPEGELHCTPPRPAITSPKLPSPVWTDSARTGYWCGWGTALSVIIWRTASWSQGNRTDALSQKTHPPHLLSALSPKP